MEDAIRTPLEQLESEAVYLLRESAALFDQAALVVGDDLRSKTLAQLAQTAFAPGDSPLAEVASARGQTSRFDAVVSPEAGDSFEVWPLFGKPPKGDSPWSVHPLASWSEGDLREFRDRTGPSETLRLLRLCTVGEAESGKSTLVQALMERSLTPADRGAVHHHLVTEQRRIFLIDPPGQEPYSHGLMAAASAAQIALLVVDAVRGVTTTLKRQVFLLGLMGVPHVLVVVNKMDLVDYSQPRYDEIVAEVSALSSVVELKNLSFLPVVALSRDNLSTPPSNLAWYQGPTLLGYLEAITPGSNLNMTDLRVPVQQVSGEGDTRRIGGRLASGRLSPGDTVVVLPSGDEARVIRIERGASEQEVAFAGDSVSLFLQGAVEIDGGDILVSPQSMPTRSSEIEATMLWLDDQKQEGEKRYLLHHGTRLVNAHVSDVISLLDPTRLTWTEGRSLTRGAIGRVRLVTGAPLYFDSYTSNRETGAFSILDEQTRRVLGTGVLRGPALEVPDVTASAERLESDHVVKDPTLVDLPAREQSYGHRAAVVWFTGLSGSGKSAVAKEVEKRLFERGCHTLFLDGDNVRSGLNGDLGFTEEARTESTRRVAELAALAFEQGQIVVCSFISGRNADRAFVRSLIPQDRYLECYVNCPIDVCRARDPKKLYEKADAGELLSFSGISIPFEAPDAEHLELRSDENDVETLADRVMEALLSRRILT